MQQVRVERGGRGEGSQCASSPRPWIYGTIPLRARQTLRLGSCSRGCDANSLAAPNEFAKSSKLGHRQPVAKAISARIAPEFRELQQTVTQLRSVQDLID